MKKFLLIIFISVTLFSQSIDGEVRKNPNVYFSLGDKIYDSAPHINNLKEIERYKHLVSKIDKYIIEVNETKKLGYEIESKNMLDKKGEYLKKLRKLSKTNSYFRRMADESFKSSVENNNSELFQNILNTGMIDTEVNEEEIVSYYQSHSSDINSSGIIQNTLDRNKAKIDKKKLLHKSKGQIRMDKIKRFREAQKRKNDAIEKKYKDQLKKKKEKIIKEQERQLFN